jgi:hypothetical protein
MAQRSEVEGFTLKQVNRIGALISGRRGVVQHVHFLARENIADGAVEHAIHRAEVAAAEVLEDLIATFDAVGGAVLQKAQAGYRNGSCHN